MNDDMPEIDSVVWTKPKRHCSIAVQVKSMEGQIPGKPGRGSIKGEILLCYADEELKKEFPIGGEVLVYNRDITRVESIEMFNWEGSLAISLHEKNFLTILNGLKNPKSPPEVIEAWEQIPQNITNQVEIHLVRPTKRGVHIIAQKDDKYFVLRLKDGIVDQLYSNGELFFALWKNENLAALHIQYAKNTGHVVSTPAEKWECNPKLGLTAEYYDR